MLNEYLESKPSERLKKFLSNSNLWDVDSEVCKLPIYLKSTKILVAGDVECCLVDVYLTKCLLTSPATRVIGRDEVNPTYNDKIFNGRLYEYNQLLIDGRIKITVKNFFYLLKSVFYN